MPVEFPKTAQDIPYKHAYEGKKIWTILDTQKRITGNVLLADDGINLSFEIPRDQIEDFKGKHFDRTTGIGDNNSRITLLNSFATEDFMSSLWKRGPGKVDLKPSLMVIHHGKQQAPEKIPNLTGYLPGIGEWFGENFLDFDYGEYKFKKTEVIYHEIPLGSGIKVTLKSKLTIDFEEAILAHKFTAYTESFVQIETTGKKLFSIRGVINIFSHVENFFNFIFREPNATHIFTADIKYGQQKDKRHYILAPNRRKEYRREDKSRGNSMLFKFADVSNVNDVFVQWIINYDKIHEIVETLILLKSTPISEEMRFTSIINALESVHRRYYDHKLQTDKDYKNRVDNIINKLKEDDKQFVRGRLQHGNAISLRKRLKEVYQIGELHGITKPGSSTTNKIISTRNYFTHGDESQKSSMLKGYDLVYANATLGRYLKLVLLQVLGVNQAELTDIVKKSDQFSPYYRDEPATKNPYA